MKKTETTLLILKKEDEILLGFCKRGFSTGKYNGVGGKLEPNENPEEAMIRECQEEVSVTPTKYEKVGFIDFLEYAKGEKENVLFHLYIATSWEGTPTESDEMVPHWFNIKNIPYDKMFPDDKYWMPLILEGKKIKAFFEFDENWNIINNTIEEVEELN